MVVGRWVPRSPWPFDARSPGTDDFRPSYPGGARTSRSYFLRLLWSSRRWHRARVACSGLWLLRQPHMPSADFCVPRSTPFGEDLLLARSQISQGKARDLRPNPAAYTRHHSWMTSGLKTNASSPTATRLIYGSCSSVRGFACSFLQIPPRGGHPCCSARSSCHHGLRGDLHPQVTSQFTFAPWLTAPDKALRAMPGARRVAPAPFEAGAPTRSGLGDFHHPAPPPSVSHADQRRTRIRATGSG